MRRMMIAALLGLTVMLTTAGCGTSRESRNEMYAGHWFSGRAGESDDTPEKEYAAGWFSGRANKTDDTAESENGDEYDSGYDYDPETGIYNPDAGYYYGSTKRNPILLDRDDYEPGSGR